MLRTEIFNIIFGVFYIKTVMSQTAFSRKNWFWRTVTQFK
jgi:hypothetical protein